MHVYVYVCVYVCVDACRYRRTISHRFKDNYAFGSRHVSLWMVHHLCHATCGQTENNTDAEDRRTGGIRGGISLSLLCVYSSLGLFIWKHKLL